MKKAIVFMCMMLALTAGAKEITCSCKSMELDAGWTAMPAEAFLGTIEGVVACGIEDPLLDKIVDFLVAEKEVFLDAVKGCKCEGLDFSLFFMSSKFKSTLDAYIKLCKAKNA